MVQDENITFLVNLAQDYYLNHLNLGDISKKYNISRYKISKYLTEATEKGIVTINISSPLLENQELINSLESQYPKHHFYILKNNEDVAHADDRFYTFAAHHLQGLIDGKKNIGLTWGDTMFHVIDAFKDYDDDKLVFSQFIGENGKINSQTCSRRLVRKAASKYDATYLTIDAPLYIINPEVRNLLKLEPAIAPTMEIARKLDLIACSIGTADSVRSIDFWINNKKTLFPNVDGDDIAAMVYGRPIDHNGNFLISADDDKTFGIKLQQILQVPTRVAVVNDKFKSDALKATLKNDCFTDIILNEPTANKILMTK